MSTTRAPGTRGVLGARTIIGDTGLNTEGAGLRIHESAGATTPHARSELALNNCLAFTVVLCCAPGCMDRRGQRAAPLLPDLSQMAVVPPRPAPESEQKGLTWHKRPTKTKQRRLAGARPLLTCWLLDGPAASTPAPLLARLASGGADVSPAPTPSSGGGGGGASCSLLLPSCSDEPWR